MAELFFFKLLSFLNDLSYRCQIGLKWKIFWSSFWLKLDRHTFFKSWMHLVNWKSILQKICPETTKSFIFGGINLWKCHWLCFSPKTTSKYLSFETNLGSVAQTVLKWERFTERQSQQNSLFWQNLPFNSCALIGSKWRKKSLGFFIKNLQTHIFQVFFSEYC